MTELTSRARRWVETVALPGVRISRATSLTGGYRNDNLLLEGDGGRWVLRSYRGPGRADVEAALVAKVADLVPVPRVLAIDPEGPSLLLEFVAGTPVDRLLPTLTGPDAEAVGAAAGRALAALGTVRFPGPGFFSDGSLRPVPEPASLAEFADHCLERIDAGWGLTPDDQDALRGVAQAWSPLADAVSAEACLVHADFNPKNLLAERTEDGWKVTVLDWEFAFSGSPLTDLGNVLRFGETAFTRGVVSGYGPLPERWRETARALDLFALAEFLTRPPKQPLDAKILALARSVAQHSP
jgi:aminoglycoside phosphotransferase (APT) family kinase protein